MVEAADAMSKTAVVGLTKWVQIDPALCTAMVRGDVGAVTAAVEAGAAAAQRLFLHRSSSVPGNGGSAVRSASSPASSPVAYRVPE